MIVVVLALAAIVGVVILIRKARAEVRDQAAMSPAERAAYKAEAQARLSAYQATRPTKSVTKQRKRTHHGGHLLGTWLSGGFWAPVWAWQTVAHRYGRRERIVTKSQ